MSDLSAFRTAVLIVQCRESRAAKARKGGVDAFGETSLQSEAALCQTKRNTLPGEGRERRILLSISINLDKNYFDKINKNKPSYAIFCQKRGGGYFYANNDRFPIDGDAAGMIP